ncbi:hypothetical protein [Alloscardovia criceti]|uniref:hypothetical protein n=1 Tax=Alloscardovia criceti TaxID=356828 RepID=UPI0012EA9A71|nr:hypothetical protein [Alloscardovia criceti]
MAKIVLCSTTVVACCAVAGSLLGLIYMRMLPSGDTFRPSYGFVHPNQFGLCLLTICISVAVYRFRKFRFIEIGIGLICFILAYFFAVSRTSSICILLTIALAVVCTLDKEGKLDRLILRCGMAILAVLQFASLYLMMFYDSGSQWMVRLDGLLSNRLVLMHHFYTDYPHSLFGHNFDSIEHTWFSYYEGFIVDNGFAHAFLESGAIVEFIIFLCWFAVLWKACRLRKLEASGLGLLLFGIAAFTEASAFYIVVNFCLVAANNLIKTERELV